ncbi:MAG: hypothetical protein L0Y72_03680 [Gemmataceae bacterium]|nr:hypothetical protein [Gemmataceae bacterium]
MGAMHNDLNRCNFMYADDRRCRNLIQNPGNPFCVYHCQAAGKKSEPATPTPADPADDDVATRAFLEWLSLYPLDTATTLNRALNQLFGLVLRNRISARQADSLLRTIRLMLKTVPDVRNEFQLPGLRAHAPQGDRFLAELREMMAFAASQDSESAPQSVAATFRSPDFAEPQSAPQNHQPPPQDQRAPMSFRSPAIPASEAEPPDQPLPPPDQQPLPQHPSLAPTFSSPAFAHSEQSEMAELIALKDPKDHSDSDLAPLVSPAFASPSERPG